MIPVLAGWCGHTNSRAYRQVWLAQVGRHREGAQVRGGELGPPQVLLRLVQHLDLRQRVVGAVAAGHAAGEVFLAAACSTDAGFV